MDGPHGSGEQATWARPVPRTTHGNRTEIAFLHDKPTQLR